MTAHDPQQSPDQRPSPQIRMTAGDRVIQIGQNFGKIVIHLFSTRAALAVTALLILVAVAAAYLYHLSQRPGRMAGDFNIAVAQFGEETDSGTVPSARATQISKLLFDYLDSEFQASQFGLTIQVAYERIGIITESRQAEQLADEIGADIVIYGRVFVSGGRATLSPRFFVRERSYTEELTGQHQLGLPLEFDVSAVSFEDEVNTELRTRATILVAFTKGLSYLAAKHLDAAMNTFRGAIGEVERSGPIEGEEVLYLLAAYVAEKQARFDEAHAYLDQAFAHNPDYARAYVERGNIYYAQATPTLDRALFERALQEYAKALAAKDQPEGVYVAEKVSVTMGNVYVVWAQQTNDPALFDKAISSYQTVTTEYEQTHNERIREIAAIAYFGLGAAYERQSQYAQARDAYRRSIELTRDQDFRSRVENQLNLIQNLPQ